MTKWLHDHVPGPVWDNIVTISVLLALGFLAFGFWRLHETSVTAARAAREARQATSENARQVQQLHHQARESCRSRHALAEIAIRRLQVDIARTVKFLKGPGRSEFGPRTIVAIKAGIRENRELLVDARRADCVLVNGRPTTPIPEGG